MAMAMHVQYCGNCSPKQQVKYMTLVSFGVMLLMVSMMEGARASSLSTLFYVSSCPNLTNIVDEVVTKAVLQERRTAASLLRLHFHDCFGGCDGSILLDDTPTMLGEKTSPPNNNSVRGFDVIDTIKAAVEAQCPRTVSCADILALAAEAGVRKVGGPSWIVNLGRRDSLTASFSVPLATLPAPFHNLSIIISRFEAQGLSAIDAIVLSGAHTIGFASCATFQFRLYNFSGTDSPDPTLDPVYRAYLQTSCPQNGSASSTLNPLDITTLDTFDNKYFTNLLQKKGLLFSDQVLYSTSGINGTLSANFVQLLSDSQPTFFASFAVSMIKMGNINPLMGNQGEIRLNCRVKNNS